MVNEKTVGIAITCIDCRLWQPGVEFLEGVRQLLGVGIVDPLTAPGPDGILASGTDSDKNTLRGWFLKAVTLHQPVAVAVVGHCNCGGNPVSDEEHEHHIRQSVQTVRGWGFEGPIHGIIARHNSDSEWPLEKLTVSGE